VSHTVPVGFVAAIVAEAAAHDPRRARVRLTRVVDALEAGLASAATGAAGGARRPGGARACRARRPRAAGAGGARRPGRARARRAVDARRGRRPGGGPAARTAQVAGPARGASDALQGLPRGARIARGAGDRRRPRGARPRARMTDRPRGARDEGRRVAACAQPALVDEAGSDEAEREQKLPALARPGAGRSWGPPSRRRRARATRANPPTPAFILGLRRPDRYPCARKCDIRVVTSSRRRYAAAGRTSAFRRARGMVLFVHLLPP